MSHTGAKALQAAYPEHIVIDDGVSTAPLIRVRVLICRNTEILVWVCSVGFIYIGRKVF